MTSYIQLVLTVTDVRFGSQGYMPRRPAYVGFTPENGLAMSEKCQYRKSANVIR